MQKIHLYVNAYIYWNHVDGPDFIKVVKEMFRKYSNPDLQKILKKYNSVNGCDLGDKIWEIFPEREKEVYVTLGIYLNNISNTQSETYVLIWTFCI